MPVHHPSMFIAILFIIAGKQSQPIYRQEIIETGCRNTMEFYSVVKKNETMKFAEKWVEL